MTNESKTRQAEKQVQDLELNRETIQDLAEEQSEQARGGARGGTGGRNPPMSFPSVYIQCI
jgi:hypothetical protein